MEPKPWWLTPPAFQFPFPSATAATSTATAITATSATATASISFSQPQPNPIACPTPNPSGTLHRSYSIVANLLAAALLCIPRFRLSVSDRRRAPAVSTAAPPPAAEAVESGCALSLFRPYVAKVPWHGGPRAFLSQIFPRYGHYCGPNWSSGKDGGLNLWDRRPVDWLDFCCYCHDIGYDTHDQAKLLKADLAFLACLEKQRMAIKGSVSAALVYRAMCIAGLRSILIPYRMHLVRQQSWPSFGEVFNKFIQEITQKRKMESGNRKDLI